MILLGRLIETEDKWRREAEAYRTERDTARADLDAVVAHLRKRSHALQGDFATTIDNGMDSVAAEAALGWVTALLAERVKKRGGVSDG